MCALRRNHARASGNRVHGIAFRRKRELTAYRQRQAEASRRDHRTIGVQQELFMFHAASPGCAFLLPAGQHIITRLTELLRHEYRRRGFREVSTPLLFSTDLWRTSGHWEAYRCARMPVFDSAPRAENHRVKPSPSRDDMYAVRGASDADSKKATAPATAGLKPMNCPGHCLIYAQRPRSHHELPLRLADFSPLHRNERSGSLSGLTRLRRFSQDDGHVFCTEFQLEVC